MSVAHRARLVWESWTSRAAACAAWSRSCTASSVAHAAPVFLVAQASACVFLLLLRAKVKLKSKSKSKEHRLKPVLPETIPDSRYTPKWGAPVRGVRGSVAIANGRAVLVARTSACVGLNFVRARRTHPSQKRRRMGHPAVFVTPASRRQVCDVRLRKKSRRDAGATKCGWLIYVVGGDLVFGGTACVGLGCAAQK